MDEGVIAHIVRGAGIQPGETVVEIGPGRGALTGVLAAAADRLILIEKDDALAAQHRAHFAGSDAIQVLHEDVLRVDLRDLQAPGPYRVVANLPYNVAGRIAMHLLENWGDAVRSMTLMFQKEVADRLVAGPGSKRFGALSVLVQSHCEVWTLFSVPPGAFRPVPKVNSAVVRMRRREQPLFGGIEYRAFNKLVHAGFGARRKTLVNSLSRSPQLSFEAEQVRAAIVGAGLRPGDRAENIPIDGWVRLAHELGLAGAGSSCA